MKPIGLIGGLTYVSTLEYYRCLNEITNERLRGSEAAEIIMYSVNFGTIRQLTENGNWAGISKIICKAANTVERAGAACLIIAANTMHKIAEEVQAAVNIPLIHIADATAAVIKEKKINRTALLGTKYTMQLDFYKNRLAARGIETIIPDEGDIGYINKTIYEEFSRNIFLPETKKGYLEIIEKLISRGAGGIIMGCTEIPVLLQGEKSTVPFFDTAKIHSEAAVNFALQ